MDTMNYASLLSNAFPEDDLNEPAEISTHVDGVDVHIRPGSTAADRARAYPQHPYAGALAVLIARRAAVTGSPRVDLGEHLAEVFDWAGAEFHEETSQAMQTQLLRLAEATYSFDRGSDDPVRWIHLFDEVSTDPWAVTLSDAFFQSAAATSLVDE